MDNEVRNQKNSAMARNVKERPRKRSSNAPGHVEDYDRRRLASIKHISKMFILLGLRLNNKPLLSELAQSLSALCLFADPLFVA